MTISQDHLAADRDATLRFLNERAQALGAQLPPLGKTPRRWPKSLQTPSGEPLDLPADPGGFLRRIIAANRNPIMLQTSLRAVNFVSGAMTSVVIGAGVDAGIRQGLSGAVWAWAGVFLILITLMGLANAASQLSEIAAWMGGSLTSARAVSHRVSRAGRNAKAEKPAGEVVTAMLNDADHVGSLVGFIAEAIAAAISFVVVAVVMLYMSLPLGLVIVIGFPLAVLGVGLLAKPIQRKLAYQREEQGKLTTISSDAVVGLRVLRGIGGEDYYNARYRDQSEKVRQAAVRVASDQALLAVMRTSVPLLFVAIVAGFGALLVFEGKMSPGELFSFVGLTAFLAGPINTAAWAAQVGTRGWVGIKKLAAVTAMEPPVSDAVLTQEVDGVVSNAEAQVPPVEQFADLPLADPESGVTVPPGQLTALVSARPESSAEIAKRLARVTDDTQAALGDWKLTEMPLAQVRKGILLAEADAQLFRGPLHAGLRAGAAADPPPRGTKELVYRERLEEQSREEGSLFRPDRVPDDPRLYEAMQVADAGDVLDSLAGGMAGWLTERGRNLSGGQRQRVALARAIYADPAVLIAIEPTSAVDSHSEERISSRLANDRRGKTTLVVSASPLWLEKCDQVIVVDQNGQQIAQGTHRELRERARAGDLAAQQYLAIISREAGEE